MKNKIQSQNRALVLYRRLLRNPKSKIYKKELIEAMNYFNKEIEFQQWCVDRIKFEQEFIVKVIMNMKK